MKKDLRFFFFLCFFVWSFSHVPPLAAAEYRSGAVRLVLDEETGRFSLYALSTGGGTNPEALFAAEDPETSFLSVMINDRSYKMGDTSAFRIRLGEDNGKPSLIFESPFMTVTEEFIFISGPDNPEVKGVAVNITLENRGDREITAGARVLLDTVLGEGKAGLSFSTDLRSVASETIIMGTDSDSFWTDKNSRLSLAGSLFGGASGAPDSVYFASWKKLHDAVWKAPFHRGRNFNASPYSFGDGGVCYYYELRPLGRGEKRSFAFALALDSDTILNYAGAAAGPGGTEIPAEESGASLSKADTAFLAAREQDLAELRELIARIDARITAGTASEEELAAMESALTRFRERYGTN